MFNKEKMSKLTKQDSLLCFVYNDLQERGYEKDYALEIVFNSYVMDDQEMLSIYEGLYEQ